MALARFLTPLLFLVACARGALWSDDAGTSPPHDSGPVAPHGDGGPPLPQGDGGHAQPHPDASDGDGDRDAMPPMDMDAASMSQHDATTSPSTDASTVDAHTPTEPDAASNAPIIPSVVV